MLSFIISILLHNSNALCDPVVNDQSDSQNTESIGIPKTEDNFTSEDIDKVEEETYWQKFKEMIDKTKDSKKKVREEITQWAKSDLKKIATWEYKLLKIEATADIELIDQLNELGQNRWECFWVDVKEGEYRLFLKRQPKSVLTINSSLRIVENSIARGELERVMPCIPHAWVNILGSCIRNPGGRRRSRIF